MPITQLTPGAFTEATTSPLTLPNLPTGYAAGTLLIAHLISREDNPTPVHSITTSGVAWTQIGSTRFLDIGTTGIALSNWYRFATSASETSPSASCPTPNTLVGIISGFNGVDTTTPLDGVTPTGGTNAATTSFQPGGGTGITTNTNGAAVICCVSTPDDNLISYLSNNNFFDGYRGSSYHSAVNTDWAAAQGVQITTTAGNFTGPTWTQDQNGPDEWAWQLFVLREAATVAQTAQPVLAPSQAVHRSRNW